MVWSIASPPRYVRAGKSSDIPTPSLSIQSQASHPRYLARKVSLWGLLVALAIPFVVPTLARAQEPPYFVTYSHAMEEPGNLEIALKGLTAAPKDANTFF